MSARACGGLYGKVRPQGLARGGKSLGNQARAEVLVDIASQGAQDLGGLGGIDGASSAEAHEQLGGRGFHAFGDPQHVPHGGVGTRARHLFDDRDARFSKGIPDDGDERVAAGERVAHQQRARALLPRRLSNLREEPRSRGRSGHP